MDERVVIIDDQITPYRIPLFQKLGQRIPGLRVLYCSRQFQERNWIIPNDLGYQYQILSSKHIRSTKPPYDQPRTILIPHGLLPALRRINPDIVVGYAFSIPTWIAFLYTRLFRKRFVSWSTDTLHTERHYGPIQRASRRLIIPRADACITPSRKGAEKFISYGADPANVKVVVQSPDVDFFAREAGKARRKKIYHPSRTSREGYWMLYVGFLSEHKGVIHLLNAYRHVIKSNPDTYLILAGEGPLKDAIEEYIEMHGLDDRVHFAGYVQQEEMPLLYASADIFIFPSLEDTFGVVIAEAAASGLPIVCSKFAGAASEYVVDGENGFIVDPKDESLMAARASEIIQNETRRKEMGLASASIARAKTVSHAAQSFIDALTIACSEKR